MGNGTRLYDAWQVDERPDDDVDSPQWCDTCGGIRHGEPDDGNVCRCDQAAPKEEAHDHKASVNPRLSIT